MGHMTGSIADIVPANRADADAFGYFDVKRSYVARRRITPRAETVIGEKIGNNAFWFTNPITANATHGSAGVSAKYVAAWTVAVLSGKKRGVHTPIGPHLENIRRSPLAAIHGLGYAMWTLAATRLSRKGFRPKRFRSSGDGGWRLIYQSEQTSDPDNRVSLGDETDSIGLPKLHIDFRFSEKDIDSVVRAHLLLDEDLRAAGAGSLRWNVPPDRRHATVAELARDGFHQLGGAVMNPDPAKGVVDTQCRVHGLDNLWVVSGSVFPTGGQANPTLMIMGLACRAAERLVLLRKGAVREAASPAPAVELAQARAARG
jgi:choline dehydrogenase-like flavoprotein